MYGARDAAQNCEFEYAGFLEGIGFSRGKSSPCIFHHKDNNLRIVVHGDDLTILGYDKSLDWFRERIVEEYEVKFKGRLGPGPNHDKINSFA